MKLRHQLILLFGLFTAFGLGERSAQAQHPLGTSLDEASQDQEPALSLKHYPGEVFLKDSPLGLLGQREQEEEITVRVPSEDPLIVYTFTNFGATTKAAVLQNPRYIHEGLPSMAGVPEDKTAGGKINLVTTWSPRLLPFSDAFSSLDSKEKLRLLRRDAKGGSLKDGKLTVSESRKELQVDKAISVGDLIEVSAPEALKGTYKVSRLDESANLIPEPSFALSDAEGLHYKVYREGEAFQFLSDESMVMDFKRVSDKPGLPLVYVWPDPEIDDSPVWIERRIEMGRHDYELGLVVRVYNTGKEELNVRGGIKIGAWQHPDVGPMGLFGRTSPSLHATCDVNGSVETSEFNALQEEAADFFRKEGRARVLKTYSEGSQWMAVDSTYFAQAVFSKSFGERGGDCRIEFRQFSMQKPGAWALSNALLAPHPVRLSAYQGSCVPSWLKGKVDGAPNCDEIYRKMDVNPASSLKVLRAAYERKRAEGKDLEALDSAWDAIKNQRVATWRYQLYSGPKETDMLQQSSPELTHVISFGWMRSVGALLHKVLSWFQNMTGSWPLAIVFLTLLLKLVTWPLTMKSFTSMQKMKLIKPKLDALKKEYGADRQRFAQEQMTLMRNEGVNPFASCFPMLLQIPIWMGLYGAILGSVELYHEPLGFWIMDLSSPDPYFILPIILGLLMFVQTIIAPQAGMDQAQAKLMKYMMPIMFTVFMLFLPSGLVLYILINTILTIGQNLLIKRKMEAFT